MSEPFVNSARMHSELRCTNGNLILRDCSFPKCVDYFELWLFQLSKAEVLIKNWHEEERLDSV